MKKHNYTKVILTFLISCIFFSSCFKTNTSGSNVPSPDGTWQVTIMNGHCSAPVYSKLINVSGGTFNATLLTFTKNGCTSTVYISGNVNVTSHFYHFTGNTFLSGNCCNGGNGFDSLVDANITPVSG
jgi:hypothetical protein